MNNSVTIISNAMIAFYLVVASNFLAQLFGCKLRYIFSNFQPIRHILGFTVALFFVVLTDSKLSSSHPSKKLLYAALLYLWFILSTRTHWIFTVIMLLMLVSVYIIDIFKKYEIENGNDQSYVNKLEKAQFILGIAAFVVTILGFIIYLGDKKDEYSGEWSWSQFFIGKTDCKFDNAGDLLSDIWIDKKGNNLFNRALTGIKSLSPIGSD